MPKKTYAQINSITIAAATSSVTFSLIPQNFRDLVLVGQYSGSAAGENVILRFNGDAGANYSRVVMFGNSGGGGTTGSFSQANQMFAAIYGTKVSFGIANIMDYSTTDKHKSTLARTNSPEHSELGAQFSRWASTAAITSLSIIPVSGTFSAGLTLTMYGIEA
jgi:hypothetical protein